MSEILVKSRIVSSGLPGDIVRRRRLTSLLKANIDKSLLLICTSAGFGKTTLANDFLSEYGVKHAWYYATSDINSFYTFFTYIIHALRNLFDAFGKNSLELVKTLQKDAALSKNYKSSIDDCIATFANEFLEDIKDDAILVIDDLHNIDAGKNSEWLNYFFDVLFENLPQNLHLIITTRDIPGFNISKLKAKRRVFQLASSDLVFDNEEIMELLEKIYSIPSTGKDVEFLQSSINGWITGIHLILQAYGREFRNLKPGHKQSYADIFNYFAKDIFENLDKNTREFLLNTAILENFNSEICDYLLNIDYSEKIISRLISKNIFIERAGSGKGTGGLYPNYFNYQELFKLFLLSELRELKTKEDLNIQFKKLHNYYLNNNEIILAVNYGLKAEEYESVVALITQNYQMLFDKGHYDILWEWADLIPAEIVKTNPHLLYLTGLLYLYFRAEPQKALKYLNEALQLASDTGNNSLLVDCNLLKTDVMLLLGNIEGLREELNRVLNLEITGEQRARVLYKVSRVLYREGHERYNEMIGVLSDALELCNEENLQSLKPDLYSMLGNVYSDWGDLVKAAHFYEQALNIDTDVYKTFRAMDHIITQLCITGNYIKAKEYLDRSTELCNSFPSLLFRRYLLRSMGSLSYEIGDFEESIRNFEELNALEIKNNIRHYAGAYYMWIGEAHYYLKKYDVALKNLEIALNYIGKDNEYHLLLNSYLKAKTKLRIKYDPGAERILLETLKYAEKNSILQDKVQMEFQLAGYYLSSGNPGSALKYLKDCLEVFAEKQYISFLEQEALNSRPLFDLAISNNLQKQFIKTVFENVRNKVNYGWLSDECKKRLSADLKSLTDLMLYSFGRTEIWLRGNPIEEEKWVRKKSKIILAYLLTKPDMVLSKDKIIDMFFRDTPLENVDTIFHNTVSNIRTAVKIDYGDFAGKSNAKRSKDTGKFQFSPLFILYENKNLSLNKDYHYDSDCLEFEKHFNLANSASSKPDEKILASAKAVELYKGEFMPGNYEPWCEEMRQNYSNMFQKLCEDLFNLYYNSVDYKNTIKYAEKLLETDKLHPEAYLKLIESHVKLNNINIAKDKFALMLKNYEEELGEKPEKQVLDKISDILGSF